MPLGTGPSFYYPVVTSLQSNITNGLYSMSVVWRGSDNSLHAARHDPVANAWGTYVIGSTANQYATAAGTSDSVTAKVLSIGGSSPLYALQLLTDSTSNVFSAALRGQSLSTSATQRTSQRKLYRESSGKLHEVFESAGEVFYRNSTNAGSSWQVVSQLSSGSGNNTAPCITMSDGTVLVVWQQAVSSNYNIVLFVSGNGGSTWTGPTFLQTNLSCASPGPIPSIAGYTGGTVFTSYRTTTGLACMKSANAGSTWASIAAVPGSTGNYNSLSSGIISTYWSTPQANVAYATDTTGGSPRIQFNYYDVSASSWGSPTDLTSSLTSEYAYHQNPNIAVEVDDRTMHVVWDAVDTYQGSTRVIVHMKGSFRGIGGVYSILQYQGQDEPSISALTTDRAWVVFQNQAGGNGSIWKQYYNGTSWQGSYGTVVGSGHDPQISVGSSSAQYSWTSGTASPYAVNISTETLSKSSVQPLYTRALNFIDNTTGSNLSIELAGPTFMHSSGARDSVALVIAPSDTVPLNASLLLNAGASMEFTLASDVDSLIVPFAVYGNNPQTLFVNGSSSVGLALINSQTGAVLGNFGTVLGSALSSNKKQMLALTVPVYGLSQTAKNATWQLKPVLTGLRTDANVSVSLGHIFSGPGTISLSKADVSFEGGSRSLAPPSSFGLSPNYPNPFNPSTNINYQLSAPGVVSLAVYDVLGRQVAELARGARNAGYYTATWNATNVASGMYYVKYTVTDESGKQQFNKVEKILLMK